MNSPNEAARLPATANAPTKANGRNVLGKGEHVNLSYVDHGSLGQVKPSNPDRLERFRTRVCANIGRIVLELRQLRDEKKVRR